MIGVKLKTNIPNRKNLKEKFLSELTIIKSIIKAFEQNNYNHIYKGFSWITRTIQPRTFFIRLSVIFITMK